MQKMLKIFSGSYMGIFSKAFSSVIKSFWLAGLVNRFIHLILHVEPFSNIWGKYSSLYFVPQRNRIHAALKKEHSDFEGEITIIYNYNWHSTLHWLEDVGHKAFHCIRKSDWCSSILTWTGQNVLHLKMPIYQVQSILEASVFEETVFWKTL